MKLLEKLTRKTDPAEDERRSVFAKRCAELTERLADVRMNFNNVTDPQTIDALIFEENAVLCRLEQLYREARAAGVSVELHERGKKQ